MGFIDGLGPRLAAIQVGSFRYNSPWAQVILVGFVCFCSVGMFSTLGGLGAGGIDDPQLSDLGNSILYAVFCIFGFFAGSINNILGPRLTLSIGTMGYSLYVGGLWAYQLHKTRWFFVLAAAILGATAALLWSAQGAIMMSYPMEKDKGRSFSVFWTIFQMGTLVGSCIALGIQANSTLPTVSTTFYVVFVIIMLTSIFTSWLILPPNLVVRGDGTVPRLEAGLTPKEELKQFLALFKDKRMLLLFPMFFASNYFYAYQGAITAYLFNGRTRALAALLTGLGSIIGSLFIGTLLDKLPFRRRNRALAGVAVVFGLNLIVWIGGLAFQVKFTRSTPHVPWDWHEKAMIGPIILIMAYYIVDAAFQGLAYYTMSALSNDPFKLARMAGYYKGIQSAGAAVSFGMDAVKTPYLTEHLVSWIMLLFAIPLAGYVLWNIPDSNYEIEKVVHVEDLSAEQMAGASVPKGHHTEQNTVENVHDDKKDLEMDRVRAV